MTKNDDELTWVKLGSEEGPELPLFRVRYDQMQHPTSSEEFRRVVLQTSGRWSFETLIGFVRIVAGTATLGVSGCIRA